jgi:hypothetical protein
VAKNKDKVRSPKKKRPLWLRILRGFLIALAVPVVLVAAVLVFIHTETGQGILRDKVVERLRQRINGDIAIGQIDFALLGELHLRDVKVSDLDGNEVIGLASLDIVPDWGSLTSGNPVVKNVAVDGVSVHLVQYEDGTSNLKRLAKAKPPEPPNPNPEPPKERRIQVQGLRIGTVNVVVDKPDGTRLSLKDFAIDAQIDTVPTTKTAHVKVPRITAGFELEKKKQGLKVSVSDIATSLDIDVENGAGTITLGGTKASAVIAQEGFKERKANLDLGGITLHVSPGELSATIDTLAIGALVLGSIELTGRIDDKGLAGEQKVQVVGLRLDHKRVNELLQKDVLASDIALETSISGQPDDLVVKTAIKTDGGTIALGGKVDASNIGAPRYDLALTGTELETDKLLISDKVPPVTVGRLQLGLHGAGKSKEQAEVDLGLHVENVRVKGHKIDDLSLSARLTGGEIRVDPLIVAAYDARVVARGTFDLDRKLCDLRLTLAADAGHTLERLRAAGLKITTELPRGAVAFEEEVITVHVTGDIEGLLDAEVGVNRLALAGGLVFVNAHAQLFRNVLAGPNDKKIELRDLDGTVELQEVNLKRLAALRGKNLDGMTGTVTGRITVDEVPLKPWADFRFLVRAQPTDQWAIDPAQPQLVAALRGTANKTDAHVKLTVEGRDGVYVDRLLSLKAHAPLSIGDDYKGIDPYRQLDLVLDVPSRKVTELLKYAPRKLLLDKAGKPRKIPDGTVFAHVTVNGTAAAPTGDIDLDVHVPALAEKLQRLKLDGTIASDNRPKVVISSALDAWLDAEKTEALKGRVTAEFSRSPLLPGDKALSWNLDLDLLPQILAELPIGAEKKRELELAGTARGKIQLAGTKTDLGGTIDVNVDGMMAKGKGPMDVGIGLAIKPENTAVDIAVKSGGSTIVKIDGTVERSSTGLLAALRDKTEGKSTVDKLGNPKLAVTVALPDQKTSAYQVLAPIFGKLPGKLGGAIHVTGDLSMPLAAGSVAYHDFKTINGKDGRAEVSIGADQAGVRATVEVGSKSGGKAPVLIEVNTARSAIKPYLDAKKCYTAPPPEEGAPKPEPCAEVKLPVIASIAADNVDLKDLVPGYLLDGKKVEFDGRLTWTLAANVVLDPKPSYRGDGTQRPPISPETTLSGGLALHDGVLTIPTTTRVVKDVALKVSYDTTQIRIDTLHAHESDLERSDRKIELTATVALDDYRLAGVTGRLTAQNWLLHNVDKLKAGPADAPRGTLTTDIKIRGDLSKPIKKLDVEVAKLELLLPDRYTRAHQPEETSTGDVIYLKEGMDPGKLPVPFKALEEEAEDPFAEEKPKEPESGLDVAVRIPKKVHILLSDPLSLYATGKINYKKRGTKKEINGKLTMVDGFLALGGKKHDLVRGHLLFDEACPTGCLDWLFARKETNAALREVSAASAGEDVNIHLVGTLSDRKTTLSGAGSPGTLFDLLSMHNAGRPRYESQPDLPTTAAPQYPQHDNLLLLSYLSVNAPHLLFLDNVAAWSDPYDARSTATYGQYRHYEAEGYSDDGNIRVRGVMRPRGAGQSEAELGFDYLFSNTPQTAFGVGLNVGSRGGGGPGVFFEWSSKD